MRTVPPDFLGDRTRWLDVHAAVVLVDRTASEEERDAIALTLKPKSAIDAFRDRDRITIAPQ